ncbi:UNVERIFIED_CONTAM: hypothetical protein PYX00_002571 [Menopon gallinae]|uniref:Myotubularin phosphatase domain-containing protein n=1 Tax=Menopon gallinae TaxID=328185 RepID=A0AAW2II68_9NEOP
MEFADLMLTSRVNDVTLYIPLSRPLSGILCITGHHLIVSSRKEEGREIWLLHSNIDHIDRRQASNVQSGGSLIIKCKDLRIFQLDLNTLEDFTNVAVTLERLINIEDSSKLYPFFYRPMYNIIEDGWTAFRPETEFNKLVTAYADEWRISYANQDFKVCRTYPSAVVVPKTIDDETLIIAATFREGGRFPVLSYRHEKGSVLMRSSQPLTGPSSKRCKEDEKLLNSLLGPGKRGYIIDTRTQSSAQNAKSKGGGFEHEMFYPQWRRIHRPIDRRHVLLDGLTKLVEACNDTVCSMDKWLSRLDSSNWLSNLKETLNCACLVAQCLDQENSSVLVHGSEGLDATLVVTSLAQVILNPDCRTVRGFEALIEREWLQAGHPFPVRHFKSCYSPSSSRTKSNSPTFLLFLDCLAQIHNQFPCSFEFNHDFLIALFEHSYSSQFGTFLGTCEADRVTLKLSERTVSLWSYVNRPEILHSYINCLYDPNNSVIWPSVAPVSLGLWSDLFLRWIIDRSVERDAKKSVAALKSKCTEYRQRANRLRRQLADLEKEALQFGLLEMVESKEISSDKTCN